MEIKPIRFLCALTLFAAFAVSNDLGGEEPAKAFLDGLRARGYHDIALDYLTDMETSRLAPAEFREIIPFESALTLVDSSRKQRDLEVRFEFLDRAQQLLRQFLESQGSHPKAYAARSQLGNLIVERARIKVEESKSGSAKQKLAEARKLYDEAFEEFSKLEAAVTAELDQIPIALDTRDKKQAALAQRRKQLRADNLQTELLAAAIREETADTVDEGSKEHAEYLIEAAGLYDAIYKKYRSRFAGLYARMYQGRCNFRLGKTKDALGYYGELLDQPDSPEEFRVLKTETLRLAMEAWLAPNERKYAEAIKQASAWIATVPRNVQREPDMLAIRLSLARAYQMQADDFVRRESGDTRTIAVSLESAKSHAQFVANEPGELQEDAQELVVALGGRERIQDDSPPATFTEAQIAGKKALDAIGPASERVAGLQNELSSPGAATEQLQQEFAAAQNEFQQARADAMASYRLALELADADTPPSELNLVRYFLCYLHYLKQQYHEAALVGEFVARRSPESAGARPCAKIALASYMSILESADEADRDFELDRPVAFALFIADQWPGSPEAIEALSTFVPVMVNADRLEHARSLTLRIAETSPLRGQSELVTGQAMWGKHLLQLRQLARLEESDAAEPGEIDALRDASEQLASTALALLSDGFGRLPEQPEVDSSNATAMLSLAQALVANSDHEKAIEVLEHENLGPMTLVGDANDAASNPLFIQETYRTALEAYVGSMKTGGATMMEKAKAAMTALREAVGSDASGKQRMLAIYVNLAQSVETQMKSASPEARQEMSKVFEGFLQELSSGSSDVGVLNWVAETFSSLGAGFDDDGETLDENARKYYERSIAASENLLSLPSLEPKLATQIRVQLASVKARNRNYSEALEDFKSILAATPNAVNVQIEAARLLQQWARSESQKYNEAIAGIPETPIWGWGKIATTTVRHQQFRDNFYEARYQMAQCQLGLANSKQGAAKAKLLAEAETNLSRTKTLYPTLGGKKWTQLYEELLKTIKSTQR